MLSTLFFTIKLRITYNKLCNKIECKMHFIKKITENFNFKTLIKY